MKIAIFWGAEHTLPGKCTDNTWYSFYNSGWKYGFEKLGHEIDYYPWEYSSSDLTNKYDLYMYCPGFLSNKTMLKKIYKPNIFFSEELSMGLCWALAHTYHYDHLCVLDYINYKGLNSIGAKNVHWVPGAVDPTVFKTLTSDLNRNHDCLFLGTYDREVIIENNRVRLDYIQKINDVPKGMVAKGYYAFEANKMWNCAKIGIDVPIAEFTSFRLFQIIAAGCLCVTRKSRVPSGFDELELGSFIPTYDNVEDLTNRVIPYWVEKSEFRTNMIKRAQQEVLEKHTFENRAKQILEIVGF